MTDDILANLAAESEPQRRLFLEPVEAALRAAGNPELSYEYRLLNPWEATRPPLYTGLAVTGPDGAWEARITAVSFANDPSRTYPGSVRVQESGGYTALQSPSGQQQGLMDKFDQPPYVPASSAGAIPFVYFDGKDILSGATDTPGVIANMDWSQIAAKLSQPSSEQAKAIVGSANLLTVALCQVTGQQPANVCQSSGVQKAVARVKGG